MLTQIYHQPFLTLLIECSICDVLNVSYLFFYSSVLLLIILCASFLHVVALPTISFHNHVNIFILLTFLLHTPSNVLKSSSIKCHHKFGTISITNQFNYSFFKLFLNLYKFQYVIFIPYMFFTTFHMLSIYIHHLLKHSNNAKTLQICRHIFTKPQIFLTNTKSTSFTMSTNLGITLQFSFVFNHVFAHIIIDIKTSPVTAFLSYFSTH